MTNASDSRVLHLAKLSYEKASLAFGQARWPRHAFTRTYRIGLCGSYDSKARYWQYFDHTEYARKNEYLKQENVCEVCVMLLFAEGLV